MKDRSKNKVALASVLHFPLMFETLAYSLTACLPFLNKLLISHNLLSFVIISEFLKRHSKAKRTRAPAYSRALRWIKGVVQRVVHGKLRSDFQRVGEDIVAVKVGLGLEGGWSDESSFWRDYILVLSGRRGGWIEEPDEDDELWLAMTVVEVKKCCCLPLLPMA